MISTLDAFDRTVGIHAFFLVILAANNEFSAEMRALCEENTSTNLISHLRVIAKHFFEWFWVMKTF